MMAKTSKYKNVSHTSPSGSVARIRGGKWWNAEVYRGGSVMKQRFNTEREAALCVDKYLISIGEEPVNILARK